MNILRKPTSLLAVLGVASLVTLAGTAHAQQEQASGFGASKPTAAAPVPAAPVPAAPAPAATGAAESQNHVHTHEDYLQAQRNMPTNPHIRNEYEEQERKAGHRN